MKRQKEKKEQRTKDCKLVERTEIQVLEFKEEAVKIVVLKS